MTHHTFYDAPVTESKQWLDDGNTFVLPFGTSRYVARKLDDDSYVSYHYGYSTFGRLIEYTASYANHITLNKRGVPGPALYSMSPREQRERIDAGEVFSVPIGRNEGITLRRMPDGAYHHYFPERSTFEALRADMARNGPDWLWQASGPEGELPTHSE